MTNDPTRPDNAADLSMLAGNEEDPVSVAAGRDIKDFFAEDGKRRQDLEAAMGSSPHLNEPSSPGGNTP